MKVPDEFRRFAIIGSKGMIEGDFVRGFLKAHDEKNNILVDEDYGAAFGKEIKGHYGADSLMAKDINEYFINGKLVGAISEERLGKRVKHDSSFPINAIKFLLNRNQ